MTNELLSAQITKFRKAAHLTQEELGRAVGVSTQAVSRWERGGAPDVTLLPAIADALHVTVDALFGREESKLEEMPQQLIRWLDSVPAKDRLDRLFRLLVEVVTHLTPLDATVHDVIGQMASILPSCYTTDGTWMRSGLFLDEGIVMGVFSEDFPLYLLLPEPTTGYAAQFAPTEDYRALFSLLSREGALELLYYLHSQKPLYYTVPVLSDRVHLPIEQITPILEDMESHNLVQTTMIETQSGPETVYAPKEDDGILVPFLYMARWFMEKSCAWYMQWGPRKRPWLVPAGDNASEAGENEADPPLYMGLGPSPREKEPK